MKAEKRKKIPSYIYRKSNTPDHHALPDVIKKKRKLQNTGIQGGPHFMDALTQVDDADESINVTQITVHGKQEGTTTTSSNELTFIRTMTLEEVNNHIQKCLEMSSENKITPKNAFALQLIDCMNFLVQKDDFSVMACTLDAGQKIYAYRIDGLHQQVIKLAEEVINNQKKKKMTEREDGIEECDKTMKKETRKASKRNILASSESLRRTLKSKDPKEKFIKIDGLPGAIMSSVKRDPKDLSFTLQNSVQFWHDWDNYKPLTVNGSVTIPHCEIYRDINGTRRKENSLSFSPIQAKSETVVNATLIDTAEESSDEIIMDDLDLNYMTIDMEESDDNKSVEGEIDVISTAIKRLNDEAEKNQDIFTVPTRFETVKMIFNKVSDYHYLNMEKAYYWAGPEFWKRPKITPLDCKDKKRVTRKKKDPNSISYTGAPVEEMMNKVLKKGSTLNKKTKMGWRMKNVTYARDIKISVKQFLDLFQMSEFFELGESPQPSETEIDILESETNCNNSDIIQDDVITDSSDSQDPLNSCFYESAPENSSSPDYKDPLNSAFYDAGLTHKSETISTDTGKIVKVHFASTHNSDTSLVPAPKIINFQPIKYKTRPIRVDMQHLKQTMWEVINENNDKNEQDKKEHPLGDLEPLSGTKLSNVLKQLPSRLEKRTAEDLFPGMALLALLTLANENNLQLKNSDDFFDVVISLENAKSVI